jgi:hypothetical protein
MADSSVASERAETLFARIEELAAVIEARLYELVRRLDDLETQVAEAGGCEAEHSANSLAVLMKMNAANEAAHARFGNMLADHQRRLLTIERRDPRKP